jgi:hypothetical protein
MMSVNPAAHRRPSITLLSTSPGDLPVTAISVISRNQLRS